MRSIVLAAAVSVACASPPARPRTAEAVTRVRDDLSLREIAPGVLLHTSWHTLPDVGPFPSNGLVVLGAREALVVDTAWGEAPTVALFDHIERALHHRVTHLVVTHAHDDRVGGIREALRRGVVVHALDLTATRAVADGYPPPTETFAREATLDVEGVRAEVFFPGAAHAPDNVVVWLPATRVLFGTCMIRAGDARALGNLSDASIDTWGDAVRSVARRFPSPAIVVPGHGDVGDASLLAHTISLVESALRARDAGR